MSFLVFWGFFGNPAEFLEHAECLCVYVLRLNFTQKHSSVFDTL